MSTTEDLLYEAAKAMARAKERIEQLEAEVCELRAEIQHQQSCCKCK
jgi:multidrug resistance efflux pump